MYSSETSQFEKPELSVIIASYNSRLTIRHCLESLRNQATEKPFEMIVVDSSTDGTAEFVEKEFPRVRVLSFPERKFCGGARNEGVSAAKADTVAFIDSDCIADENWVDEILKAHVDEDLAVGGSISNRQPCNWVSWSAYFCEFSKWMPGTPDSVMGDVAGANMSYKKRVFHEVGRFIENTYCSDTEFHWRMAGFKCQVRFVPAICITHESINRFWAFIRHEFCHGRFFARVRVKSKRFSKTRRFAYAVLSCAVPFKLLLEICLVNLKNRIYIGHFLKSFPGVFVGLISWSAGECCGYIKS